MTMALIQDDVIRIGDLVRRVRGGTHSRMREGDEGIVADIRERRSGYQLITIEGFGAARYTINNYEKVPTHQRSFSVGDKVIVQQNTSGLPTYCIGQTFEVLQIAGDNAVQITKEFWAYARDLRLAKPKWDTSNFKNYVKTKMAANVAAV